MCVCLPQRVSWLCVCLPARLQECPGVLCLVKHLTCRLTLSSCAQSWKLFCPPMTSPTPTPNPPSLVSVRASYCSVWCRTWLSLWSLCLLVLRAHLYLRTCYADVLYMSSSDLCIWLCTKRSYFSAICRQLQE
jgi:hypothetical protein